MLRGAILSKLTSSISSCPPLKVPFQVPPLPAHFVPRPVVSRDLKARLLADGPTAGSLVVSAVHGLGGVGKSTLAADLAHDSEVKERFPDGVLWATLGQQPDLLPLLSGWVQALGDYDFKPLGTEAATSHLRTLLHDKAALLVVDDAWDPAQVPPFLVGGPRCRVVITTRDATIAKAVGATLYDLDVMSPEQALALLAGCLRRGFEGTERDQALLWLKRLATCRWPWSCPPRRSQTASPGRSCWRTWPRRSPAWSLWKYPELRRWRTRPPASVSACSPPST